MNTSKRPLPQLTASSARQLPTAEPPLATAAICATCTCLSTLMLDGRGGVACAACRAPVVAAVVPRELVYSMRNLPPDVHRCGAKFLRLHRRGMAIGLAGCWCEGRSRLMTASAWARLAVTDRRPAPAAPASAVRAVDPEEAILSDLGLTRRSAS